MSTKPPAQVQPAQPDTLENIAYGSVASIPTEEPNDRIRLGYHVWHLLADRQGDLRSVIRESGARIQISVDEAERIIREGLSKAGISLAP